VRDDETRTGSGRPRLGRGDVYPGTVVDGRRRRDTAWRRLATSWAGLLTSRGEREEAVAVRELLAAPPVTRCNVVAVVSPKGGVGKTTCTFLAGTLLASGLRLRVLAMDANRDFGTLASLAPDRLRSPRSMADLLADLDRVHSASQLRAYVAALPSGLDLLGAPDDPVAMAALTPEAIGQLLAWLGQFYDVVLLDLGTGIIDPLAQFGLGRADQAVVVTSPDFVTTQKVIGALDHLRGAPTVSRDAGLTLAVNQVSGRETGELDSLLDALRAAGAREQVVLPRDEQLRGMLDSATFNLDALRRPTRLAVRALGLAVARRFV
jgi:putative peptide zinc metalloprotease protein